MTPTNRAALLTEARAYPFKLDSVPYPEVGANELIVKVAAAALNPMDWYIQLLGEKLFPFLQYPLVSGTDVAGTVEEVGEGVTKFKKGDRVLGLAAGFSSREGAFQSFTVLHQTLVSKIPDHLHFESAAVLPLGLSTAACGLYQKDHLALDYPSLDVKPKGKTLLIWAGSSSVGSNAIQLAVASGYEVFTTASPKNFDYVKKLGAAQVFDYHSETVLNDLLAAFKGKTCAGGFAIQLGSEAIVFEVVAKSEGAKFVTCAMQVPESVPEGIKAKMIFGSTLKDNEVGPLIYDDFLPAALAQKKFNPLPEPLVVGHGLEYLQEAYEKGKSGTVSAQKLVITL